MSEAQEQQAGVNVSPERTREVFEIFQRVLSTPKLMNFVFQQSANLSFKLTEDTSNPREYVDAETLLGIRPEEMVGLLSMAHDEVMLASLAGSVASVIVSDGMGGKNTPERCAKIQARFAKTLEQMVTLVLERGIAVEVGEEDEGGRSVH